MPKIKYVNRKNVPEVDWLWAAVLERMRVYHYDLSDLAAFAGVHYDTMRDHIRQSPWTWRKEEREAVCEALGIRAVQTVEGAPREDWRV